MIDTSELMFDPDFCETVNVERTVGLTMGLGGPIPQVQPITLFCAVQIADAETLEMVPEGDRIEGSRVFWSASQIYETNSEGLSDVMVYHSAHWRVVKVWDRSVNGFWKALAARMEGA